MSFSFDKAALPVASAQDFLEQCPHRARPVRLPHLGLTIFGITDCLCLGSASQAVGPLCGADVLCVFRESCPYPANEFELPDIVGKNLKTLEECVEIEEAVPLFPRGVNNLWHFTTESLPKLLALESIGYTGPYIIPASIDSPEGTVVAQSLAMFGIKDERLLRSGPVYRVKRLMLPQRLTGFDLADNMPLTGFVRQRLIEAVGLLSGSKRLYIRRVGRRRPLNEEDVLELLNEFGFTVMVPEEHALREQWLCMTNVDHSVMVHGANATLTLLQKPESGSIEIFSNRYVSYCNLHAARYLRMRHHALVEELEPSSYPGERMPVEDFLRQGNVASPWVDTLHLRILLENMLPAS